MTTNEKIFSVRLTEEQQQTIKNVFKDLTGKTPFCFWLYKDGRVYVMKGELPAKQISNTTIFHGVDTDNQFSRYYRANIELVFGIDEFKKRLSIFWD